MKTSLYTALFASFFLFVVQGCATSESSLGHSADTRIYTESYEKVNEKIPDGLKKTKLGVLQVEEEEDGSRTTYYVVKTTGRGKSHVQQEEGKVRVEKTEAGFTKVVVENPEYHYTVPSHEKEDYQKIIFRIFDQMLTMKQKKG